MYDDSGGGGGGGSIDVTPAQLHNAGSTLRGVSGELDGQGGLEAGDLGYPDLEAAVTAFCQLALSAARTFSSAVEQAGQNVSAGAGEYERTEAANTFGGP